MNAVIFWIRPVSIMKEPWIIGLNDFTSDQKMRDEDEDLKGLCSKAP
jgi:hypothetical protein